MMRLVKQLAGIQDGGTTASPSFITGSPASNAGSSKNGQIVSKMGGDVVVECTIETDSYFSFTHFENPEGDKERTHEFHTRELARALIRNEFDGPREVEPAATRSKASGASKSSAPPGTPRNTSKAPITSNTPECEKHTTRSIANLPEGHMGSNGHHVACASGALRVEHRRLLSIVWHVRIFQREMLVCVCSRKRGAAETDEDTP